MFRSKKNGQADLDLDCQVDGCGFACHDYKALQKHAGKVHPGLQLECRATGCDYVCSDYITLERHTSWAHRETNSPA